MSDEDYEGQPGDEFDPNTPGSAPHSPHLIDGEAARETLIYPAPGTDQATAQALLKAAEDLGYDPSAVNWRGDAFGVPQDVADAANVPEAEGSNDVEKKATRRQRAAAAADTGSTANTGGDGNEGTSTAADATAGAEAKKVTPAKKAAPAKAARR